MVAVSKCELTGSDAIRERLERAGPPRAGDFRGHRAGPVRSRQRRGQPLAKRKRGGGGVMAQVVVDAGNSLIKWGHCSAGKVAEYVQLPAADSQAWARQLETWQSGGVKFQLAVSGSDPGQRDRVALWLREQGHMVQAITSLAQVPVSMNVTSPEKVGLDRLLNALAVQERKPQGAAAAIIDAGTAITVDYVDEAGVFQGGAILPGLKIMADYLHEHTAALPLINPEEIDSAAPVVPGKATVPALILGMRSCLEGGIERLLSDYAKLAGKRLMIFVGGGDGRKLVRERGEHEIQYWPEMTLEGIRLAGLRL